MVRLFLGAISSQYLTGRQQRALPHNLFSIASTATLLMAGWDIGDGMRNYGDHEHFPAPESM